MGLELGTSWLLMCIVNQGSRVRIPPMATFFFLVLKMDVFSYCAPVVAKEKIPHFASGFPILKEQPRDEVEQLKYIVLQNAFFFAFLQHMTYFRSTLPHGEKL